MNDSLRILIGYDGSACAESALDDLKLAGLPEHAEVQILSVAERWLPPPPPPGYEIIEEAKHVNVPADLLHVYTKDCKESKALLGIAQQACERVQTKFPGWKVTAHSRCGSPSSELLYQAQQWKPDLIVVGSQGRTALGRFVLGSVSQRVLSEAPCSVRVARGRIEEPNTPVKIIVGIDGSEASDGAVRAVAERNWPAGSEVILIAADELLFPEFLHVIPVMGKMIEEDKQWEREWAGKISARAVELLKNTSLKVKVELRQGDPKQELPKAADEMRADCIFVGSVGFNNRFQRFVLGSVSAAVAARAHCSVEVVRIRSSQISLAT